MRRRVATPLPWLAGLLAVYLIAPLAVGLHAAALAHWRSVEIGALLRACAISLASATTATVLIALGGIPLGYLLARVPGRAIAALGFLVQLPLALPPLTSGILLLFLLGYGGPLGALTGRLLTDSFAGIVLAETFVAAPFLIIAARSAFASMDATLEGVAATLGRGPSATFLRVSLPIGWPTISAGMLLAWLRAFGEFGATVMVAYHPYSLPVYTYVAFGAQGLPAMLPILMPTLVLAVLVLGFATGLPRRRRTARALAWPEGAEPAALSVAPRTGLTDGAAPLAEDGSARSPAAAAPESVAPAALELHLRRRLGEFRLDLDWSARARRLAILGPSGSGKSLTLRLIAGIDEPDEASMRLDGRELSGLGAAQRQVSYVPQSYGLFPHLRVVEQLRFPAGAEPASARRWIERLKLTGLEQRLPDALSLGQQQRVALARALVHPARLLLLDEPFSALDAPLRARLRREMLALQRELEITTLLVTHDPEEAALLADEILVLEHGRVLQAAATATLFARPASETVARLLGAELVAEGLVTAADRIALGAGVELRVAGTPLTPGARVGWSLRPAAAHLSRSGAYEGRIEQRVPLAAGSQLTVRLGEARVRLLGGGEPLRPGDGCRLEIDPCAVQVWPSAAARLANGRGPGQSGVQSNNNAGG